MKSLWKYLLLLVYGFAVGTPAVEAAVCCCGHVECTCHADGIHEGCCSMGGHDKTAELYTSASAEDEFTRDTKSTNLPLLATPTPDSSALPILSAAWEKVFERPPLPLGAAHDLPSGSRAPPAFV